jgi:hypothetical protein
MPTNVSNSEILMELIDKRAAEHGQHEMFDYILHGTRLPMDRRFSQLNKFIAFSFMFSDMMDLVARHYETRPGPYSAEIVEHCRADMHHFRMLVSDFRLRMGIDEIKLEEMERVIYAEKHLFVRLLGYQMISICLRLIDRPVPLMCFLEAIEGSSRAAISGYREALVHYQQFSGLDLQYFGDAHMAIELAHESLLSELQVSGEELDECKEIIEEHFVNAWKMLDATLESTYEYEKEVLGEVSE